MKKTIGNMEKTWNHRNDDYGIEIGNDILIKGCNLANIDSMDITTEDIETECGSFSNDSYYLIIGLNGQGFGYDSIREIDTVEDLVLFYCYHNN